MENSWFTSFVSIFWMLLCCLLSSMIQIKSQPLFVLILLCIYDFFPLLHPSKYPFPSEREEIVLGALWKASKYVILACSCLHINLLLSFSPLCPVNGFVYEILFVYPSWSSACFHLYVSVLNHIWEILTIISSYTCLCFPSGTFISITIDVDPHISSLVFLILSFSSSSQAIYF